MCAELVKLAVMLVFGIKPKTSSL